MLLPFFKNLAHAKREFLTATSLIALLTLALPCAFAATTTPVVKDTANSSTKNVVLARTAKEAKIEPNQFTINFYKPTYILPYYYTDSPSHQIYQTKNNESIQHTDFKYQLSFKVPVWKNIYHYPSTLFLGYTQLSYWQAYNHSAFFRETDFEPELFVANEINLHLYHQWTLNFFNIGIVHQSNGFGGDLERTWNRVYVEAVSSAGNWMISVKPWIILHDGSLQRHNPNIGHYLGYGDVKIGYKYGKQVFFINERNLLVSAGHRATTEATWSFPLTAYVKGYVQVFSGYGQSLIEYNHRTNSFGLGFVLSDWV